MNAGTGPLVVVYGLGSAGPVDILRSAGDVPVLLVADSSDPHTARMQPLLDFFDDRIDVAGRDVDAYTESIRACRPIGIVTFSERMLPRTADLAVRLGLPGHSPAVAVAVTDKGVQRRLLAASSRLATRYELVDTDATGLAHIDLPAVAKPLRGEGGTNVRLLREPADVAELMAATGRVPMLVEEYFRDAPHPAAPAYGSYVSVEAFVVEGRSVPWAITDKLRPADPFFETGSIAPSRLPDAAAAEIRDVAAEAVRLLGIRAGTVHVEIKLTPCGPRVIEVNGRLGGSVAKLMAATRGWDAIRASMDVALGREPVLPGEPTACAVVVHVPTAAPVPVTPRLRERVRAVDGVAAVDTAVDNRMLFGAVSGGPVNRLIDLTVTGPDFRSLWESLAAAVAVLRDDGAPVTDDFAAYVDELRKP